MGVGWGGLAEALPGNPATTCFLLYLLATFKSCSNLGIVLQKGPGAESLTPYIKVVGNGKERA